MFETIDMLLLPLLSRIFSVLSTPATGTDEVQVQRSLKSAYLQFFMALMNANLDGVFISERNKPEFENVLSTLLELANEHSDPASQRLAFGFFAKSVIAWGTSADAANAPSVFADSALSAQSRAVANGQGTATNQHAIARDERASLAVAGYESFIYQRLVPLCFEVPADSKFVIKSSQQVSLILFLLSSEMDD
jgi:exportin-T